MNLSADAMATSRTMRSAVGGGRRSPVSVTPPRPIDPEPAIGIEHDLDDDGVSEPGRYRWSERGA